jgi:hypothetical protein
MAKTSKKYGCIWAADNPPLWIELQCIAKGGTWKNKKGEQCGEGLFWHKLQAFKLAWPKRYVHRWTELILKESSENIFTVFMGSASSQKTSTVSASYMLDWWADAKNTLFIISTTTIKKLENSIFAQIKTMFTEAKALHDWLPGRIVDYKHAIIYEDDDPDSTTAMDRGIQGIACRDKSSAGLGNYAGIKAPHMRIAADDLAFMKTAFLACLPNLYSNYELKVAAMSNSDHDVNSPLGMAAEPLKGWTSYIEPDVTTTWPTKLYGGKCVNLVGTDSPNNVEFSDEAEHYKGLIGPRFTKLIAANSGGVDSEAFKSQVKGVMCLSMAKKRVITRDQCTEHHASNEPVWEGVKRTKICALDPAYGGGDDCVEYNFEFGRAANGKTIFAVIDFRVIPILILKRDDPNFKTPEIQIALAVKKDLEAHGCPVQNCGYDSFGKGTIGQAFAQVFGFTCPVPIDAGGRPTMRNVREGEYVMEGTHQTRRLKRWDEHVDRFITELWFRVSYAIDSDQIRGLPEEAIEEGCQRQYKTIAGNKLSIEKKEDLKLNNGGKSPNNFDCIAIGLEMAVRLGFVIERLGSNVEPQDEDDEDYYESERRRYESAINNSLLTPM